MSRKERRPPRAERIRDLLTSGDHRAAGAEARAILADGTATPAEREAASAALASLAPDPGAVVAGALGVAVAIAIVVAVLVRG